MGAKLIVVGGGIVGAMTARELVRRGHGVTLVEMNGLGSAVTGASLACLGTHMNSRSEIHILKWAAAAWREFSQNRAEAIEYRKCGQLRFLKHKQDRSVAEDWIAFEASAGLSAELLEPDQVRHIEPLLTGRIEAATHDSEAATVTPFLAVRAVIRDALDHGLALSVGQRVQGLNLKGGRVRGIVIGEKVMEADCVVLAAGPWTRSLAATANLDVPIQPRKAQCLASVAMPQCLRSVIAACDSGGGVPAGYTQIQQAPSGQVLFNTVLAGGLSANGAQEQVSQVDIAFLRNSIHQLVQLFPSLGAIELLRSWVRYEAVTPDDHFLVGPSGVDGLYLAAGDGGNGFCRAPAIARAVADVIDSRVPPFDISMWSPDRFRSTGATHVDN